MPAPNKKVLSQLVEQFKQRHNGKAPEEIVIHPVALAALALIQSIAPVWNGIRVRCYPVKPDKKVSNVRLGITVYKGALRAFDL